MPLYDYRCQCGWEGQDIYRSIAEREVECVDCNFSISPLPTGGAYHEFPASTFPTLMGSDSKVEITSRRQLREECDKRNVYSHYLEGA